MLSRFIKGREGSTVFGVWPTLGTKSQDISTSAASLFTILWVPPTSLECPLKWSTNYSPPLLTLFSFVSSFFYSFSPSHSLIQSLSLSLSLPLSPRPQPSALCALTCAWAPMRSPVEVIVCYHSSFNMLSAHCTYLFSCLQTQCMCVCVCNTQRERERERERERPAQKEVRPLLFSYIMGVNSVSLSASLCFFSLCTWCPIHTYASLLYYTLCYSMSAHSFIFSSFSANCISQFLLH